jgi:ribose transport system ATP-binding protein
MIGRDASTLARAKKPVAEAPERNQKPLLEAQQLKSGSKVKSVSLALNAGEVLGIAGLLGSGRSETAQLLFGDLSPESGSILVSGKAQSFSGPADAIRAQIAFCPEDRKQAGIFPHMSVLENLTIVLLPELSRRGIVDRAQQREVAAKYVAQLGIKTADLNTPIRNLSGGNQQKVILSRWLCKSPKVVILDEPTRGIDVGAKSEIAAIVEGLASGGIAVMLISSELEELTQSSDRIVVLREGRNIAELSGAEIRDQRIAEVIAQGA